MDIHENFGADNKIEGTVPKREKLCPAKTNQAGIPFLFAFFSIVSLISTPTSKQLFLPRLCSTLPSPHPISNPLVFSLAK